MLSSTKPKSGDPILDLMADRMQVKALLDAANARASAVAASLDDQNYRQASPAYRAAIEDAEQFLTIYLDIEAAICRMSAVTIEGAMAKLEVACDIIRDARTNSDQLDIDEIAVSGALDDLKRFLRHA